MSVVIAKSGRTVRFLGKKEVFDVPLVGQLATALGGIRVDRATGSDEPLEAAADALAGGEVVAIMPQGTIPRGPAFFDPELQGRWARPASPQLTKAPVIPVGLWGTERVWRRSSRLPNVLNVTGPPTVRIRVGPPVELKYRSLDADTKRIMAAIGELLPAEARRRGPRRPKSWRRRIRRATRATPRAGRNGGRARTDGSPAVPTSGGIVPTGVWAAIVPTDARIPPRSEWRP